ncbi:hypothetical protein B7463_g5719, partial [Scytalidium lignicola]
MHTKHFFSDPNQLVISALKSFVITNPSLAFDQEDKIIFRRSGAVPQSRVSIISGGGSGHEPAFAGLVGKGLLTASVAGTIFASPSSRQICKAALECVDTGMGVLIITMNYTGDMLNFGLAAEKARLTGKKVKFLSVGDDVGVGRLKSGSVGRRGICGTVLTVKIAGALAETGASLDEVYRVANLVSENLVSLGASLDQVHVPGRAIFPATIPPDEVEVGVGIHNESGSCRLKNGDLSRLIDLLLLQLLDENDQDRNYIRRQPDDDFVLLINNLGGLSPLELAGIVTEVCSKLDTKYSIRPVRTIHGTFLTSLNAPGFNISLLRIVDTGLGEGKSLLDLLDAPAEAVGWTSPITSSTWKAFSSNAPAGFTSSPSVEHSASNLRVDYETLSKCLSGGLRSIIAAEPSIIHFDTIVGDGDCGVGLKRGAEAVLELMQKHVSKDTHIDIVYILSNITGVVERTMDGTSGAVYAIFLNSLTNGVREQDTTFSSRITVKTWTDALDYALSTLLKYTPAKIGDRTLMDTLIPFCKTLVESENIHTAIHAARDGTEATKNMRPKLGRSVYVGSEERWLGKIPDPGAYGLFEFLNGLAGSL